MPHVWTPRISRFRAALLLADLFVTCKESIRQLGSELCVHADFKDQRLSNLLIQSRFLKFKLMYAKNVNFKTCRPNCNSGNSYLNS